MYLYKIDHSFHPYLNIRYFYDKNKTNSINLFFNVLGNNFLYFHLALFSFSFIFQNCFFFNLIKKKYWMIKPHLSLMKSYTKWFHMFKRGLYCRNRIRIQVLGLGNRINEDSWRRERFLVVKLGHAHSLYFFSLGFMTFKKHKRKYTLKIFSTNRFLLANFIYVLRRFRGPNCYTGNGVKYLKEKLKYKPRKKWGVF